jgi:hypothetical protein
VRAPEFGYDPNKWFGNVEQMAQRSGNVETVMYVRNIANYTMAYKMAYDRIMRSKDLKKKKAAEPKKAQET